MSINSKVDNFKTRYKMGFVSEEIRALLETHFSQISWEQFWDAFGIGHTCTIQGHHTIYCHCDVASAIWVALKRQKRTWETK
jgi:hypothetical protein